MSKCGAPQQDKLPWKFSWFYHRVPESYFKNHCTDRQETLLSRKLSQIVNHEGVKDAEALLCNSLIRDLREIKHYHRRQCVKLWTDTLSSARTEDGT